MSQYLFILGRNWKISIAELAAFLQSPQFQGRILNFSKNCALIEFNEEKSSPILNELQEILGGTQKIAESWGALDSKLIKEGFPIHKRNFKNIKQSRKEFDSRTSKLLQHLIPPRPLKMMFAVSVYPQEFSKPDVNLQFYYPHLNSYIHSFLKQHNVKSTFFRYPDEQLQSGTINPIWPHNVINYSLTTEPNAEVIFSFIGKKCYVGRTIAVDNPNLLKKIDEERPHTAFEFSTPPKLAKIMINLTHLRKGQEFLDPFCGTGTHLMVVALRGISIHGTDLDPKMIEAARANLIWLCKDLNLPDIPVSERMLVSDVRQLTQHFAPASIHAIATEPYLGPALKKHLSKNECEELLKDTLNPLFNASFKIFYEILVPGGRVSFIAPIYLTQDKDFFFVDVSKHAQEAGFKEIELFQPELFVKKPEFYEQLEPIFQKKGQRVIRRLHCFKKEN